MYQKRHHGSSGPKSNKYQLDTSFKQNNSYTQLHFENSLGTVQVNYKHLIHTTCVG